MDEFDVLVVGGGPAGLSAALILGRCRRNVLVCDAGSPRNAAAHELHGFLTRDGIEPAELLKIGRAQLSKYSQVEFRAVEVVDARRANNGFVSTLANNDKVFSRRLLLATGVVDELPNVPGLRELYGRTVFHCPYCDGWEMRDRAVAVYARDDRGVGLALELTQWSENIVLCIDGKNKIEDKDRKRLDQQRIEVYEEKIVRLEGNDGYLKRILFAGGKAIERDCLFFSTDQYQRSDLAERLGCEFSEQGCVKTGDYEVTTVKGVYAAGDASRLIQLAIVAAAEGAQAAFAINQELLKEDLAGRF